MFIKRIVKDYLSELDLKIPLSGGCSAYPKYSGVLKFDANLNKKVARTHLNQQKLGQVAHAYHPSYAGSINRMIMVQPSSSINSKPYSKHN
jgi:hypothetical protein